MNSFITLTPKDSKYKFYTNPFQIGAVIPKEYGSELLIQGVKFEVQENSVDILNLIERKGSRT